MLQGLTLSSYQHKNLNSFLKMSSHKNIRMKKQLPILLLFFFTCLFAFSQGRQIKTTTPCDKELLKKTPGRWMPFARMSYSNISKQEEQEILRRLGLVRQWTINVYPLPMAFDAMNYYGANDPFFAAQLKIERTQDRF